MTEIDEIYDMTREELVHYIQVNLIPCSKIFLSEADTEALRNIAIEYCELKE